MEITNTNVLVTGGAGFIGSFVVDELIKEEPDSVVVVDNLSLGKERNLQEAKANFKNVYFYKEDVSQFERMRTLLTKHKIDIVFNLAVIPLPASLEKPRETTDENNGMVTTICELQRLGYFNTLIHFSSSEAYGSVQYEPMDEHHPLLPATPYAASKAAGDLIVISYHNTFKTNCRILRPFNNYGPRQNEGSYAGVIPITIKRILRNQPPILQGSGDQTRDFIFVTDTAKAAVSICKNDNCIGEVINVGGGKEISIEWLINKIVEQIDYKGEIIKEPERPGDVKRHLAGIEKAKKIINFKPEVSFEEGLTKTIEWYRRNFNSN